MCNCGKKEKCIECENKLQFSKRFNCQGNILISDQFNNRVIEVNSRGEIVWSYGLGPNDISANSILGVKDALRVGRNTLMVGSGIQPGIIPETPGGAIDNRVILVNKSGTIIWQYGQFGVTGSGPNELNNPVQATHIRSKKCPLGVLGGTVLIVDRGNNRVIEVDEAGIIVATYTAGGTLNSPSTAQKLKNGNVLIADGLGNRAVEVDLTDLIVATYTASSTLGFVESAHKFRSGNILLVDSTNNKVIEVNSLDQIVWQYVTNAQFNSLGDPSTSRAYQLKNNNTCITNQYNNQVIIINQTTTVLDTYGLNLTGTLTPGYAFGTNVGYNLFTSQLGLYAPFDAKVIF